MTNTFTWQQLTIISNQDISEQLNTWLNLLDAEAIENSPDGLVNRALFLPNIAIDQVKVFLQKNISADLAFELKIINNTDWHATQNLDLKPIEINSQLAIYPDNFQGKVNHPKAIYIQAIDAFGTGNHPTTFQCLQWLSKQNLVNKQLIDFGCGSGILAIAALSLGAKNIHAIDIDPKAIEITQHNANLNHLNLNQLALKTELEANGNYKADIILANLFANPLCELIELFNHYLSSNGQILLAGMLMEQSQQVMATYEKYFSINIINELDGWPLLLAKKKA